MHNATTQILVLFVAIIAATLLAGHRIGYEWAGGDGVHAQAEITDVQFSGTECYVPSNDSQHEHAATCAEQMLQFMLGDALFLLDEKTDVSMLRSNVDDLVVDLITGRVIIRGNVTVHVRNVRIVVHGTATLVHYSWQNKIDVRVFDGTANVRTGDAFSSTVTPGNAVAIDTLPPYDAIAPTLFPIDTPNVKAFYDWAVPRLTTLPIPEVSE